MHRSTAPPQLRTQRNQYIEGERTLNLLLIGLIDGVLTGAVYALMAAGLTLIFGVLDMINIAQGIFVILGSYLSLILEQHAGIGLFPSLIITIPAMFGLGLFVEWAFIRRIGAENRVTMSILITYAVMIIVEGVLLLTYGSNYQSLSASYVTNSFLIAGHYIPEIYVYGFILSVAAVVVLYAILYRTRLGTSLRASMDNAMAASLVGVNVKKVSTLAFGIGVAVTAIGGMLFGAIQPFTPNTGYDLISRLLSIVVLGGLGSVGGALGGAMVMLIIEDVVSTVWSPTWAPLLYFAVLIVVLIVKPTGIFGRQAVRSQ
jgi:branched-chain amino acid transport system permease protein